MSPSANPPLALLLGHVGPIGQAGQSAAIRNCYANAATAITATTPRTDQDLAIRCRFDLATTAS